MLSSDKKPLQKIESWPEADQYEIETRRTGPYRISDCEREAVRQGMDAAAMGHFAPDDEMEEFYRLHSGVYPSPSC
jgi:hypothetical protein